jgi:hypothetical protein
LASFCNIPSSRTWVMISLDEQGLMTLLSNKVNFYIQLKQGKIRVSMTCL